MKTAKKKTSKAKLPAVTNATRKPLAKSAKGKSKASARTVSAAPKKTGRSAARGR